MPAKLKLSKVSVCALGQDAVQAVGGMPPQIATSCIPTYCDNSLFITRCDSGTYQVCFTVD